jgi:hypothetical protein
MTNQTTLTNLEIAVLHSIVRNEMNSLNYGEPESVQEAVDCCETWMISVEDGKRLAGFPFPAKNQLGGVLSSLVKKGLILVSGGDICTLTESGAHAWFSIIKPLQDAYNQ